MTNEKTPKTADLHAAREPLFRLVKRSDMGRWQSVGVRAAAVVLALLVSAIFAAIAARLNPIQMYATMFRGNFGNDVAIWSTIGKTVKLLCIALGLAVAFKMRFWNIGGEGQVLVGALATAMVMIRLGGKVPSVILFLLMLIFSVVAGGVWGLIPAIFKAKWNTNETLFTLMMNYIAIQLVSFYYNKWKGTASSLGQLNMRSHAGWFPEIFDQRFTINVFVVVALMFFMYFYMNKTKHGYEIAVVGASQNTARYAGINVKKVIIRTMVISGAICGLCGFLNVAGQDQTVSVSSAGGYGFTAIIVAWMASFNPFYMLLDSFFIVFLERGTRTISDTYAAFNEYASAVVIGIILFFVIGSEFFLRYRVVFRRREVRDPDGPAEGPTEKSETAETVTEKTETDETAEKTETDGPAEVAEGGDAQ